MHLEIDAKAKKAINKRLATFGLRITLGQGSTARYMIQRKRLVTNSYGAKPGSWYAIGLAYGEQLANVLKDETLEVKKTGDNGWYVDRREFGDVWGRGEIDEHTLLSVELILLIMRYGPLEGQEMLTY